MLIFTHRTHVSFATHSIQTVLTESTMPVSPVPSPETWMRSGYSPTEIILAIAVLIASLSTMLYVLVPVMMQGKE